MLKVDTRSRARLYDRLGRWLIAAGGIRSRDEVDTLDRLGIDAVVGMAIYTGKMEIRPS
jgi:phosphoribosylformimino-5-aminoimidazole carboxamide ribotide isomerase